MLLLVVALVVQSEAGWTRFRFRGRRIRDRLERAARYIRDKVRPGSKLSFPINTRTPAYIPIFLHSINIKILGNIPFLHLAVLSLCVTYRQYTDIVG